MMISYFFLSVLKEFKDNYFQKNNVMQEINALLVKFLLEFYRAGVENEMQAVECEIASKKSSVAEGSKSKMELRKRKSDSETGKTSKKKMKKNSDDDLSTSSKNTSSESEEWTEVKMTGNKMLDKKTRDDTGKDFMRSILKSCQRKETPAREGLECMINELERKLEGEVASYTLFCESMDIEKVLDKVGNEKYFKEKNQLKYDKNHREELELKNVDYLKKYFDVLAFWQMYGKEKWPKLTVGAMLILGKPSHNGFQERVFSKGNYKDGQLKKRQHADTFEMAVLESFNSDFIENPKFSFYLRQSKEQLKENTSESATKLVRRFFQEMLVEVPAVEECILEQKQDDNDSIEIVSGKTEDNSSQENPHAEILRHFHELQAGMSDGENSDSSDENEAEEIEAKV